MIGFNRKARFEKYVKYIFITPKWEMYRSKKQQNISYFHCKELQC